MRTLLALAACLALCACKDKQEQAPAATQSGPAATTKTPRPALPSESETAPAARRAPIEPGAPAEKPPIKPISVADAMAVLPAIEGTQVIALKQTSDQSQVHGTWCIDGTSAEDVAKQMGQRLAQAKYTNITIRGDERKAGVAGDREGIRLSMVVSASSASVCQAPAHYFASATIFRL